MSPVTFGVMEILGGSPYRQQLAVIRQPSDRQLTVIAINCQRLLAAIALAAETGRPVNSPDSGEEWMKKVSRQREWQKRQRELGNCTICGQTAALKTRRDVKTVRGSYCEKHKAALSEYYKRRYHKRKALDG
jgi:hypothetical protein